MAFKSASILTIFTPLTIRNMTHVLIHSSFFGRGAACDLKCLSAIKRSGYVDH